MLLVEHSIKKTLGGYARLSSNMSARLYKLYPAEFSLRAQYESFLS